MLDDALLADWCLRYLGAPFERVTFRSGFLSDVVGVELPDGLRAVVKARPFQPRIAGCLQVQAALARAGFPCPEPLTVATRVRGMTVTADRLHLHQREGPRKGAAAAAVAAALAEIKRAGGGVVEAYPEQTGQRPPQRGAYLHTGPEQLYARYGFTRVRKIAKWRWVMRTKVRSRRPPPFWQDDAGDRDCVSTAQFTLRHAGHVMLDMTVSGQTPFRSSRAFRPHSVYSRRYLRR